jgi:serine/threonine protein kinase
MTDTISLVEEHLLENLDEALEQLRLGKTIDSSTWQGIHPDVTEEGIQLLETLILLSFASDTWRDIDRRDTASIAEHSVANLTPFPPMIGRYVIRGLIGSGGMGDVYDGYDPQLDRRVAVKVPRCEKLEKNRAVFTERFLREARASAAVRHENICPVYDTGKQDEQPYVVMAFVDGESLESVLSRGRFEDLGLAVRYAAQVAEALEAIHQHGIIHRDLKPGNILIDLTGHALLTDFGLAVSAVTTERLTVDGLLIGTPVYMSPEQASGENSTLSPAADIYSLGAVLYEMITGVLPFRAPLLELLRRIKMEQPPPLETFRPEIDPALSSIVGRAMAKSTSDRFQSAAEFAAALYAWKTDDLLPNPLPSSTTHRSNALFRNAFQCHLRRNLLLLLILVAVIAVAVSQLSQNRLTTRPQARDINETQVTPSVANAIAPVVSRLEGGFEIIITSDNEAGSERKFRLKIDDRRAFPLRNGELVQFEAYLNQPAYIYMLWVTPDGAVTPIYPWDAEHFPGFDAPFVDGSQRPTDHVICPKSTREGFEATDPIGLQTFVMLARREPLAPGVDLGKLLARLPAGPKFDHSMAMMQPRLRGIATGRTKSLEHALYDELETRLSPHFELVQMMTFPQVAD